MTGSAVATKMTTYLKLGLLNLLRIIGYRLKLKAGWWQYACPIVNRPLSETAFFAVLPEDTALTDALKPDQRKALLALADDLLDGHAVLFSRKRVAVGAPPLWHQNPFTEQTIETPQRHWSKIPDFSEKFGDIKTVWELSRAEWAPLLAQAYRITGEARYLTTLNDWLADWQCHNPLNRGPNWKCGQEVSFRVLHSLLASLILDPKAQNAPSNTLLEFVEDHSRRIAATLPYAIAQDNNHGTSEAAALFICGHWLLHFSSKDEGKRKLYSRWAQIGRKNLENRISRLVLDDGTFSQYSPTYQRVVLATLTQVLLWQNILDLAPLSETFLKKSELALNWLMQMTDHDHGDVPNLGANDGANVFRLSWHEPYRDFRPVITLLAVRLGKKSPYQEPDYAALWFGSAVEKPQKQPLPNFSSLSMPFGGFEKLLAKDQKSWALLRTAKFKFRPSHADLNHFDLWVEGQNILMDSGSYSYAKPPPGLNHPLKTAFAHNTITFDDHDQMPSLGRFLYGDWPNGTVTRGKTKQGDWVESSITFADGNTHRRHIQAGQGWIIRDTIEGPCQKAVLRWHLPDLDWQLAEDGSYSSGQNNIHICAANGVPLQPTLKQGVVSHYYLETTHCKVLEVELVGGTGKPQSITTIFRQGDACIVPAN